MNCVEELGNLVYIVTILFLSPCACWKWHSYHAISDIAQIQVETICHEPIALARNLLFDPTH